MSGRVVRPFGALLVAVVAACLVVVGGAALVVPLARGLASNAASVELPEPSLQALAVRSVVYDDAGHELATLAGPEDRSFVRLGHIAVVARRAVLAAEDRDFYHHGGVDWRGVVRAATKNFDAGSITQGGSTITQQLVKNTLFTDPKRDIGRKLKEAVLAIALERRYSKDAIFQQYLNTVYFGEGAYGIGVAAERYFGTTPDRLDLAQSAQLAALIANPEDRDPVHHPDNAATWRDHVLDEMVRAHWATPQAAKAARFEPIVRSVHMSAPDGATDPFVEEVKRELLSDPRIGDTYQERYRHVFEGGLRIYTTFDPRLQALATLAATSQLPASASSYTAAMVVIDNSNGAVRAIVPGSTFHHAGFDLATQGLRQTGSAFKAITLAAALEDGFSPDDRVNANGRCTFDLGPHAAPWQLHNYEGESLGTVTLTRAIAESSNCAFARVALAIGPQRIVDMAHRLGITRKLDAVPSITLGTEEVTPLDMATAFSVFAADGMRHPARFVERVTTSNGRVLIDGRDRPTRVLDPQIARTETDMLTHVITEGTAHRTLGQFGRPAAGKTGTNDQSRDVWFVGYTPQLTAAVWIGNPGALVPVVIDGAAQVGGNYPARIWGTFMQAALRDAPPTAFAGPDPSKWPPSGYITETGRTAGVRRAPARRAPVPTVPASPVPDTQPPAPPPRPPHHGHGNG